MTVAELDDAVDVCHRCGEVALVLLTATLDVLLDEHGTCPMAPIDVAAV